MIILRLTSLLALGVALGGCSNEAHADAPAAPRGVQQEPNTQAATAPSAQRVTIPIEGMSCGSCAEHLQQRLAAIEGVVKATVDFDKKQATLQFDPKKVTVKKLVAEINKTFTAGKPKRDSAA